LRYLHLLGRDYLIPAQLRSGYKIDNRDAFNRDSSSQICFTILEARFTI
jgi:hypothetical protein